MITLTDTAAVKVAELLEARFERLMGYGRFKEVADK